MVRYQAYALALQVRFKWRHKDTDVWRRLMDATCFVVDWIGKPLAPTMTQYGGHWCHIVTCAHVLQPWDYPNFYPPVGVTKFVSRISAGDTMCQMRVPTLDGNVVHKHFTSRHHTYTHTNPRLDLAVCHSEQNYKRYGEVKMLWMQNEGWALRPRLDVLTDLQRGDEVWVYGMNAQECLMDDEPKADIKMIPTGVKGVVRGTEQEHFWVKFEDNIPMGMCGGPILRDGKCVGMLTAMVHQNSENKTLAGCARCTYARDIRQFLMEVEKQMKNPVPRMYNTSGPPCEYKDWSKVDAKLAQHTEVPISNTRIDGHFHQQEGSDSMQMYGNSGLMNREFQENFMGLDAETSTDGKSGRHPDGTTGNMTEDGRKTHEMGNRPDPSPAGYYGTDEFKMKNGWDTTTTEEAREAIRNHSRDKTGQSVDSVNQLNSVLETMRDRRVFKKNVDSASKDPQGIYFRNQDTTKMPDPKDTFKRQKNSGVPRAVPKGIQYDTGSGHFVDQELTEGLWDQN